MLVAENLDFDVAGAVEVFLEVNRGIAESVLSL